MPLRVAPLPIQFAGGVETKQDSKQVPTAKLLDLQNATFIKATTLSKRNGYLALGNTVEGTLATLQSPQGIGVRGTELVKFDGQRALSYLPNTDRWSDAGDVMSVVASSDPIARTGDYQQMPDVATNNGVTVVAWEDNAGGVWYSLLEADSKRVIVQPTRIVAANAQQPRCLAVGEVLHLLYAVPTTGTIYVVVINPAIPSASVTPQVLVSELSSTAPLYDACTTDYNSDKPGLIVFATPVGAGYTYKLGYIAPSGVLGSPLTGLPSVNTGTGPVSHTIACAWSKSAAYPITVIVHDLGNPGYAFFDSGLSNTDGGTLSISFTTSRRLTLVYAGIQPNGDAIVWWALEVGNSDDETNQVWSGYVDLGGGQKLTPGLNGLLGHGLLSRAWNYGGNAYVTIGHPVKFFSYAAVIKLQVEKHAGSSLVAARVLPGGMPGLPQRTLLPSVIDNGDGSFDVPLTYRIQLGGATGDTFSEIGIRLYRFEFNSDAAWQSTQLGRGLYIASACMQHYDGDRVAEADFHAAPDTKAGTIGVAQGTGGSLTLTGTYAYKIIYEEVDGQGELHRGPTSVQVLVTLTGSNNAVTLTIPTYLLTAKRRVRIGVFRSDAGATGDDSQIEYLRVSSLDPTTVGATNGYVLNTQDFGTVTFVDHMSDAVLDGQEPLYTNGGVLSNDPPTFGGAMIATAGGRLLWDDCDDPDVIHFSQPRADETAAELVAALSWRKDHFGGAIVAIGVMDDAIYAFAETAIYGVAGAGPDITGGTQNTSYSPAALVTSDVGCKAPGSICQAPIGITFQSSKGIMLLGRDRQVVDIGGPVYAYNDQTIVRATLLPDRHQILFLTEVGRTLLYDYEHQQWSTYTNHEGLDAVVVEGVYHYLRTDGRVFQETPGLYKDDNSHIPMLIETAWIKLTGYLQGWQRVLYVYWLGTYLSKHTLRMRYRVNYKESYSSPIDMDVNANYNPSLYGAGNYGAGNYGGSSSSTTVYQRRKHLNRPCQAISFQIQDVEAADDYGASFQLSELLLIGGVLGPAYQPGAARS